MAKERDLDLEVVEAGVAYTLYSVALVDIAIVLNKGLDPNPQRRAISKHAKELKDTLVRCGVDKDIRVDVGGANDILKFLQDGELIHEISNLLVRHHSRRQELIFLLTCAVGAVISGSTSGISKATKPARSQAIVIGGELGVPESVIDQCIKKDTITPLRHHFRSSNWSDVIEAKPSLWGITFDLKKLFTIIRRWLKRKWPI